MVSLSTSGLIGREPQGTARSYSPSRHDVLDGVLVTTLHQPVWAFTSGAKLARARALELPEVGGRSRGKPTNEAFATERADSVLAITGTTGGPLLVVTALGLMKRLDREALADVRPGGRSWRWPPTTG